MENNTTFRNSLHKASPELRGRYEKKNGLEMPLTEIAERHAEMEKKLEVRTKWLRRRLAWAILLPLFLFISILIALAANAISSSTDIEMLLAEVVFAAIVAVSVQVFLMWKYWYKDRGTYALKESIKKDEAVLDEFATTMNLFPAPLDSCVFDGGLIYRALVNCAVALLQAQAHCQALCEAAREQGAVSEEELCAASGNAVTCKANLAKLQEAARKFDLVYSTRDLIAFAEQRLALPKKK